MKFPSIVAFFAISALTGLSWAADTEKPAPGGEGKPPIPRDGERPRGPGMGDQGPGMHRDAPPKFSDVDADQSGDISKEEWVAFQVKRAEERANEGFKFLDANKDGKLVEAEMPKPRMEGPGGDRPDGGPRGPRDGDRRGPKPEGDGKTPKRPPVEGVN